MWGGRRRCLSAAQLAPGSHSQRLPAPSTHCCTIHVARTHARVHVTPATQVIHEMLRDPPPFSKAASRVNPPDTK